MNAVPLVLRVPQAPAISEAARPGMVALQTVRARLQGLLQQAEQISPVGDVLPARTSLPAEQPRVVERPRHAVD